MPRFLFAEHDGGVLRHIPNLDRPGNITPTPADQFSSALQRRMLI